MTVLVAYASRYGATAEIAERIALTLIAEGVDARAQQIAAVRDFSGIDAFVVGSAVYFGSWLKPATTFVERHHETLAERPVWLFSSGPLPGAIVPGQADRERRPTAVGAPEAASSNGAGQGTEHDAGPKGVDELATSLGVREHRVFDGRLDPTRLHLRDRIIRTMPAGKGMLPAVDARDWSAIEEWARQIAAELRPA